MIAATSIEFIKNLADFDYENQNYDFHNDFTCKKISYVDKILTIIFNRLTEGRLVTMNFTNVDIAVMNFFNTSEVEDLTIDTLYRGRAIVNGELLEVSNDNLAYFYLEFYEGQQFEFWAKEIYLKEE